MSTSNNKKRKIIKKVNLSKYIIGFLQLVAIGSSLALIYWFSTINLKVIDEAHDIPETKNAKYARYFDEMTVETLIEIDNNKNTTLTLPEGRIDPFSWQKKPY